MKKLISILGMAVGLLFPKMEWAQQVNWQAPVAISSNGVFDQVPSLDVGPSPLMGERIYVAYSEYDQSDGAWEIRYAWKDVASSVWNSVFATDKSTSGWPNSHNWEPSIKGIAGGAPFGMVFIAYLADIQSPPSSDDEILQITTTGAAFNLPVYITNNATDDRQPSLAVDGTGTAHVAYAAQGGTGPAGDYEIWYDLTQVTTNSTADEFPSLFIDSNNNAHIAFAGEGPGGDYEIWYAENTTGAWTIILVDDNGYHEIKPSLRVDGAGYAHIAWQGLTDNGYDIFYSNNTSGAFLAPIQVTAEPTDEEEPSLVIDPDGKAHIAYQWTLGEPPDQEIYYTHNMSGTFTSQMGAQTQVSTGPSTKDQFPSMDIDANKYLHLAYQGFDGADTEIYYVVTTHPVPVELVDFKATLHHSDVILSWRTTSESNNFGFDVERSQDGKNFDKIGFVAGYGTTVVPQIYSFTDSKIGSGTYYYRLKQIDFDGSYCYSSILEIQVEPQLTLRLHPNFPNPFNPATVISYSIPSQGLVKLDIYNSQGAHVINLVHRIQKSGNYHIYWDGRNQNGKEVGSGVYIARLKLGQFCKVIKMIKIQ